MAGSPRIEDPQAEARYHGARYDLYRAKMYASDHDGSAQRARTGRGLPVGQQVDRGVEVVNLEQSGDVRLPGSQLAGSAKRARHGRRRALGLTAAVRKGDTRSAMRVAIVSTYPPRACGIGTFSRDLR